MQNSFSYERFRTWKRLGMLVDRFESNIVPRAFVLDKGNEGSGNEINLKGDQSGRVSCFFNSLMIPLKTNRFGNQLLFRKGASRLDSRDQWKSSPKMEIIIHKAFYNYKKILRQLKILTFPPEHTN